MDRVWLLAILIGCVPPQQQPSYFGQQQGQGQQGQGQGEYAQQGQPAASGMTCMGLFQCFQACADGTCIQACLGQADPATQAAASAFMQCGADKCQGQDLGGDCLNTNCQTELDTCRGSAGVAYAEPQQPYEPQQPASEQLVYPDQPHTTANLLPWMTGQWIGTNHQFEFWADGRVRRSSGTPMYSDRSGSYKCVSVIEEIGTVRQEGDLLIMDFPPANSNHCGEKEQAAQGLTVRYKITWYKYSDSPTNLLLVDIDCTKGAMWCNDQMRRR